MDFLALSSSLPSPCSWAPSAQSIPLMLFPGSEHFASTFSPTLPPAPISWVVHEPLEPSSSPPENGPALGNFMDNTAP